MSDAPAGGSAGGDHGAGGLAARAADAGGDGGGGGVPEGGNSGEGNVTRPEMGNPIPVPPAKRKRGPGLAKPHVFLVFGPPVPGAALHVSTVVTVPRAAAPLLNGPARVGPAVPGGNLNPRRPTGGVHVRRMDREYDMSGGGSGGGIDQERDNDLL